MRGVLGLIVLVAILALPVGAVASPQDLFGFGGRTPGLAMTGASHACDFEAVFANPAQLACVDRRGLFVGATAGGFRLRIDGERFPVENARQLVLGFQMPIPFGGVLEDRLVLGSGFITPSRFVLRGQVPFPETPYFAVLDRSQVVAIQLGLGIDLHGLVDGLRIGAGVSALADLVGDLYVRLNEESRFVSETETQLLANYAPILGATYERGPFAVAVTYRGELSSVMSLDVVTADLPVEVPPLTLGGVVQYDPHTFVVEASYLPMPAWRIVANATLRLWNAWPGAQQRTTRGSLLAPDPELSPTVSPRVAVEHIRHHRQLELSFRAGYAFEPTPAPPARMAPLRGADGEPEGEVPFRLLDGDRHVATAGLGVGIGRDEDARFRLDLYGQLHWLPTRTHRVPAGASSGEPLETDGWVVVGGFVAGVEWR